MRTDAADTLDEDQRLDGVALGAQLLYAAVVVADKDLGVLDNLALGVELGMERLLQRWMVRAYGDDIAHWSSSFLCLSAMLSSRFSTSSESGMTRIWPLPWVSSMFSGKNRRLDVSSPSKSMPMSS